MQQFEPNTYEEIQERFFKVFHRDMTRDERQCFLSVDKYWMSGYFLGMAADCDEREKQTPGRGSHTGAS